MSANRNDGVAENEFHIIHQDLLPSEAELDGGVCILQCEDGARLGKAREIVVSLDLSERDIVHPLVLRGLPSDLLGPCTKSKHHQEEGEKKSYLGRGSQHEESDLDARGNIGA